MYLAKPRKKQFPKCILAVKLELLVLYRGSSKLRPQLPFCSFIKIHLPQQYLHVTRVFYILLSATQLAIQKYSEIIYCHHMEEKGICKSTLL